MWAVPKPRQQLSSCLRLSLSFFLFFFFLFLPSFATGNRLGISVMLTMVYPASAATPTDDGFPL